MKKHLIVAAIIIIVVVITLWAVPHSSGKPVFEKKDTNNNVDISLRIDGLKKKELMGEKYSFVYLKYSIKNHSAKALYFHPGKIVVGYNGLINQSTEYDSLASAMTEEIELPKGQTEYFLYFVFKQPELSSEVTEFEIQDTGIRPAPD